MISNEEIEQKLQEGEALHYVKASGDGYHYQLVVVSDLFLAKSTLARQQWVYAKLKQWITDGKLHALTMKTWTVAEWEKQGG